MVLKFLGIGKKSEFVLEAPPADSQPAAKAKPAAAEPSHTEAVAAPAVESNGKAPSTPAQGTDKGAGKTSGKTLKEVNAEKKAKAEQKATPEVKAAPAAKVPAPQAEPAKPNFATTLQLNNTPRRRPGPSLDMFKDMAKQVGPRK
jgi:hypothetical protein